MNRDSETGLIFNIQKFSLHDGPGIRDLVFLKGCPLRCKFCDNPESQNSYPEIAFNEDRCIGCKECERVCSAHAIVFSTRDKSLIDRQLCTNCGACADACPAGALRLYGKLMSVEDVLAVVEQDSPFYWRSGGGMTVSGGEPAFQAEFVHALLREAKRRCINTAIQTCGQADWVSLEKICAYADTIFYDLKHMDPERHKAFTGVTNALILDNLLKVSHCFPNTPIIIRTPIVPGFNDSVENIQATVQFLAGIPSILEYRLLPYHRFGQPKYAQLDRDYPLKEIKRPTQDKMEQLKKMVDCINSRYPINPVLLRTA
jgi:pyruvate formate lyase activating enzyme